MTLKGWELFWKPPGGENSRTKCNDLCPGNVYAGSLYHSHYFSGYLKISIKNQGTTTLRKDKPPNCPNAKWVKNLNRHFYKDARWMANSIQEDTQLHQSVRNINQNHEELPLHIQQDAYYFTKWSDKCWSGCKEMRII